MKEASSWLLRRVAAKTLGGLLLCWLLISISHAQILTTSSGETTFQGEASALGGTAAGGTVSVADTGALAATGGAQEASAIEASVAGGIAVGVSHATTIGEANAVSSEAAVANVVFTGSGAFGFFLAPTTITADFIMAQAAAACAGAAVTVTGQVQINGLVINGQAVSVTGAANQIVMLADGGFVIINEQSATGSTITVNGLHVLDAFAGVDIVFASATAGIGCGTSGSTSATPPPCDFITGGGWIVGTPSGAKANFGVAGGIKNGEFWGHLNYVDHGSGMHVKATAVTGYAADPNDPNCRIIDYTVTIEEAPGTARVRACDNGEPGWNDVFEIQLSNGYSAGGDLGGSQPGGGNIQLHKCQ